MVYSTSEVGFTQLIDQLGGLLPGRHEVLGSQASTILISSGTLYSGPKVTDSCHVSFEWQVNSVLLPAVLKGALESHVRDVYI